MNETTTKNDENTIAAIVYFVCPFSSFIGSTHFSMGNLKYYAII
jgi:hypothetical protein